MKEIATPGQPNNNGGDDCLLWWEFPTPYWHDYYCTNSVKSVCEDSGGDPCNGCISCASGWTMVLGRCYFLSSTEVTFSVADSGLSIKRWEVV